MQNTKDENVQVKATRSRSQKLLIMYSLRTTYVYIAMRSLRFQSASLMKKKRTRFEVTLWSALFDQYDH